MTDDISDPTADDTAVEPIDEDTTATVAVAQTVPEFGAVEANRKKIAATIRERRDADLIVLPELATTGYVFESRATVERLAVQICNDLWFPEQSTAQAQQGVELVAVPTNWVPGPSDGRKPAGWTMGLHVAIANANTNRLFFACADRAGTERGVTFQGQSAIVDPDGLPIAGPGPAEGECVLAADCDLVRASDKTLTPYDDAIADRRPEIYRNR